MEVNNIILQPSLRTDESEDRLSASSKMSESILTTSSVISATEDHQLSHITSAYEKLRQDYEILQAKYQRLEESNSSYSGITISRKRAKPRSPTPSFTAANINNKNMSTQNYYASLTDSMDTLPPQNLNNNTNRVTHTKTIGRFTRTIKPLAAQTSRPTPKKTAMPPANNNPTSKEQHTNKKSVPPPIVAYHLDHKQCTDHFPSLLGSTKFKLTKVNKNCSRIQVENKNDFTLLKEALKKEQTSFHTFTPADEKPTSVILRNLCSSYDNSDIENALNELNMDLNIRSVSKLETDYSKRTGKPLDLWNILLDPPSDITRLLKTTNLLHQKVRFERRKNKNTLQCHNCQHFGHTAKNCNRPYRCVKCTEKHAPGECSLPQKRQLDAELSPTCVNCKENHAANYKGCSAYQSHMKKSHLTKPKAPERILHFQAAPLAPNALKKGISYAAATHNQSAKPAPAPASSANHNSIFSFLDVECNTHFNMAFNEIYTKTVNFKPTYEKSANKPIALISFILSITPASK